MAASINDRLFPAFVAGWFAGVVCGAVYGSFHWHSLQIEMGRLILLSVTISQVVTLIWSSRIVRHQTSNPAPVSDRTVIRKILEWLNGDPNWIDDYDRWKGRAMKTQLALIVGTVAGVLIVIAASLLSGSCALTDQYGGPHMLVCFWFGDFVPFH